MNNTNDQHEGNKLLKQLIDISQNTLEAQNMQLEVLQRFDCNMNMLADRIERTNQVLEDRILQTNQVLGDKIEQVASTLSERIDHVTSTLGEKIDQTNQTVQTIGNKLDLLVDISERNVRQSDENFGLIAHQFGVMNDKLDQVIDLKARVRSIEADMKEIKWKVA